MRSSFEFKVNVILSILRAASEEGEDISLNELLSSMPDDVNKFCKVIFKDLLSLPPRVFLARLMYSKTWVRPFEVAAKKFLKEVLSE